MTSLDYVMIDDDGNKVHKNDCATIPRELIVQPDKLARICARNKLADLHRFYWDKHAGQERCYPGTIGTLIDISSDGVKETNVQKRKLHIISVRFDNCNQPVPWYVDDI